MDRDQALAVLATCRHLGLIAWTGHVRGASGEQHVVCCRPAPGRPVLWLLSPADLRAVEPLCEPGAAVTRPDGEERP